MTPTEHMKRIIVSDPVLDDFFRTVSEKTQPNIRGFGGLPLELVSAALLYPVAYFIIKEIGLPWLYELKVYSDLWRTKFHVWIEQQYKENHVTQQRAKIAGEVIRKELERLSGDSRKSFEQLLEVLSRRMSTGKSDGISQG